MVSYTVKYKCTPTAYTSVEARTFSDMGAAVEFLMDRNDACPISIQDSDEKFHFCQLSEKGAVEKVAQNPLSWSKKISEKAYCPSSSTIHQSEAFKTAFAAISEKLSAPKLA